MSFKMKYEIKADYLKSGSKKRPGNTIKPKFIVAHDTGNPKSTARNNVNFYKRVQNTEYASAHLFVDDKEIIECVPALTATPERAYHVIYDVPTDNNLFGDDANDAAIGVELCFGGRINNEESYKKYVWVLAYICYKFGLNPAKHIAGHFQLDPKRKSDPVSGLKTFGKTFEGLISDVVAEYNECKGGQAASAPKAAPAPEVVPYVPAAPNGVIGKATILVEGLNIRQAPDVRAGISRKAIEGEVFDVYVVQDGWANVGGANWIFLNNGGYARYVAKGEVPYPGFVLKRGDRNRYVEMVQQALGLAVDGIFGPHTQAKVAEFQQKNGLVADGIIGENTWAKLF